MDLQTELMNHPGVPEDRRTDFRSWTNTLIAPDPVRPTAAKEAVGAMAAFFVRLIVHKRRHPADDLDAADGRLTKPGRRASRSFGGWPELARGG
ncbi:hypothetical protein ACFYM0_12730 [Streptomyces sp. NPDC006487]|uniref:hypothetical protein n=1 Tax=Streptomyces sp. NPDC006487 TaxID=3364748 RepID=UPI00369F2C4F